MKITKVREPRYNVELSKREVGIISYLLGNSSSKDFEKSVHKSYATELTSDMYEHFNDAWCAE